MKQSKGQIIRGAVLGWICSATAAGIGAAIASLLILNGIIAEQWMEPTAMLVLSIAAATGACLAIQTVQERKLLIGAINGCLLLLSALACHALFFDGEYRGISVCVVCVMGASAVVSLLTSCLQARRRGGRKSNKMYKLHNR